MDLCCDGGLANMWERPQTQLGVLREGFRKRSLIRREVGVG